MVLSGGGGKNWCSLMAWWLLKGTLMLTWSPICNSGNSFKAGLTRHGLLQCKTTTKSFWAAFPWFSWGPVVKEGPMLCTSRKNSFSLRFLTSPTEDHYAKMDTCWYKQTCWDSKLCSFMCLQLDKESRCAWNGGKRQSNPSLQKLTCGESISLISNPSPWISVFRPL